MQVEAPEEEEVKVEAPVEESIPTPQVVNPTFQAPQGLLHFPLHVNFKFRANLTSEVKYC